jgi:hypothetical protein
MTVTLPGLYALLVLGASIQERHRARPAFLALVPFALVVASFGVNPGSGDPRIISQAARASASAFFAVNAGLLLLGAAIAAAAGLAALRDRPRSFRGLVLLGAAGIALWIGAGLAGPSGPGRSVLAGAGVAAVAAAAGALARRLRRGGMAVEARVRWPGLPGNRVAAFGFGLGALAAVAGPRVGIVFAGLALTAAADFLGHRGRAVMGFPWLLVAVMALAPVWWLMATIAGPGGLPLTDLGDVPLSLRAEILLALPVGLVAWACFALWPAHRLFPGGLFAPLGAALWLRVGSPALAGGLQHWQTVLVPIGALGLWGAAITGRRAAALNATAFVTLASEAPGSGLVALLLTGAALAVGRWSESAGPAHEPLRRLGWASAALVLPAALEAGFRSQVTYTLAAAAGFALGLWLDFAPCPDPGASDSGTPGPVTA